MKFASRFLPKMSSQNRPPRRESAPNVRPTSRSRARSAARTPVSKRPLLDPNGLYGTRTLQRQRAVRRRRRLQNAFLILLLVGTIGALAWKWKNSRNAASGSVWSLSLDHKPSAAPLIFNDTLWISTFDGQFIKLKNADSKAKPTAQTVFAADFALRVSPVALGENVIVTSEDGSVSLLDQNGKTLWKYRSSPSVSTRPLAVRVLDMDDNVVANPISTTQTSGNSFRINATSANVTQSQKAPTKMLIVGSDGGQIVALKPDSGQPIWKRELNAPIGNAMSANPDNSRLFVPFLDSVKSRGGVVCLNTQNGATLWKAEVGASVLPAPAVGATLSGGKDQRVFVCADNGSILCFDAQNGKLIWKVFVQPNAKLRDAISLRGEPLLKVYSWGARLFIGGNDGFTRCLDAQNGREVWRFQTEISLLQRPVSLRITQNEIVRDVVFVAAAKRLCALDARNGAVIWRADSRDEIAAFAANQTSAFSVSHDGVVERFGFNRVLD